MDRMIICSSLQLSVSSSILFTVPLTLYPLYRWMAKKYHMYSFHPLSHLPHCLNLFFLSISRSLFSFSICSSQSLSLSLSLSRLVSLILRLSPSPNDSLSFA